MMGNTSDRLGFRVILVGALALCNCGDVEVDGSKLNRLHVLHMFPKPADTDIPKDLEVIVVFSDSVSFENGESNVNLATFYLEDGARQKVTGSTVEKAPLDEKEATAIMRMPDPSPLQSGGIYWVVLRGAIKGKNTDPLGTEIRYQFSIK